MDSYRGIYSIKFKDNFMYAWVYVTPENADISLGVSKVLKEYAGIEHCYYCQESVDRKDITGWVGIRLEVETKELHISIYGNYDTPNQKTLLDETFPIPPNSLMVKYNI